MNYDIAVIGFSLFSVGCVVALFFCRVEAGPRLVKEAARAARFKGKEEGFKPVRFW